MKRAVAAALLVAVCGLFRSHDDVSAALRARELMVPVAGVAPGDVPDTFGRAPRDAGAPCLAPRR